jgi:hypothetical protein
MTPGHDLQQHRLQRPALVRQLIGIADGMFLVGLAPHQTPFHQPLEAFGQDVGRNAFGAFLERVEGLLAVPHQVADDEQRPLVADDLERARDRAARAEIMLGHGAV